MSEVYSDSLHDTPKHEVENVASTHARITSLVHAAVLSIGALISAGEAQIHAQDIPHGERVLRSFPGSTFRSSSDKEMDTSEQPLVEYAGYNEWKKIRYTSVLAELQKTLEGMDNDNYFVRQESTKRCMDLLRQFSKECYPFPAEIQQLLSIPFQKGSVTLEQYYRMEHVHLDVLQHEESVHSSLPPMKLTGSELLAFLREQFGVQFTFCEPVLAEQFMKLHITISPQENSFTAVVSDICKQLDAVPVQERRNLYHLRYKKADEFLHESDSAISCVGIKQNLVYPIEYDVHIAHDPSASPLAFLNEKVMATGRSKVALALHSPHIADWESAGGSTNVKYKTTISANHKDAKTNSDRVDVDIICGTGNRRMYVQLEDFRRRILGAMTAVACERNFPEKKEPTGVLVNFETYAYLPWPKTTTTEDTWTYALVDRAEYQLMNARTKQMVNAQPFFMRVRYREVDIELTAPEINNPTHLLIQGPSYVSQRHITVPLTREQQERDYYFEQIQAGMIKQVRKIIPVSAPKQ